MLLTEAKVRLKFALPALKMPESITGECIDKRTCRIEPDLVKDEVDAELVNVSFVRPQYAYRMTVCQTSNVR